MGLTPICVPSSSRRVLLFPEQQHNCVLTIKRKIKLSCNMSRGGWTVGLPSLLWHSSQPGWQSCQLYAMAVLYPQRTSLVFISVRGWVEPRAAECGQKDRVTWKFPRTPPGSEAGNFRPVPQSINQLWHCSPRVSHKLHVLVIKTDL